LFPWNGLAAASLLKKVIDQARRPVVPQGGCPCYEWGAHGGNPALEKTLSRIRAFVRRTNKE